MENQQPQDTPANRNQRPQSHGRFQSDPPYDAFGQPARHSDLWKWIVAISILAAAGMLVYWQMRQPQIQKNTLHDEIALQLNQLDRRLSLIEQMPAAVIDAPSANTISRIDVLAKRMDRFEANLASRTAELENKLTQLQASLSASAPAQQPTPQPPVKKAGITKKKSTAKYHTVVKGDTLFGICRKYNINIDQLCKFNDITPKSQIHPGQKLKISNS